MIVFVLENIWWPFGAHLLHVKGYCIAAMKLGAKIVYTSNTHHVFPKGRVDYYFEDWSRGASKALMATNASNASKASDASRASNASKRSKITINYDMQTLLNVDIKNYVHPNYASMDEMHSAVLWHLYKPSARMQSHIDKSAFLKSLAKLDGNYIAMHVRWTDKVHGEFAETVMIDLGKYMKHAVAVRARYPEVELDTIVLCTDNVEAFEKLVHENNKLARPFRILYDHSEERSQNTMEDAIVRRVQNGTVDKRRLVREYINGFINFEIMLRSFSIIGNFDSGYCLVPVQMRNMPHRDVNVRRRKPIFAH